MKMFFMQTEFKKVGKALYSKNPNTKIENHNLKRLQILQMY